MCSGGQCSCLREESYNKNSKPILVKIDFSRCLSEQTWHDLHLNSVLGEPLQVKSFLMHPCSREELFARQRVFAAIRDSGDDSVYKSMVTCREALFTLKHSFDIWHDAKTYIEQTYLFIEVLRGYLVALQSLKALQGGGRLQEAAFYFQNIDDTPLSDALDKAQTIIDRISCVHISHGDRQWVFATIEGQDRETVFEELCDCAKNLELHFAVKERSPIYPDQYLSEAFRLLYKQEFEQLEQILKPFSDIDFAELSDYIPSFDFYLQMENFYRRAEKRGLVRCIPAISDNKQFCLQEMYDFTLISSDTSNIVPNQTFFTSEEPFFFLVGANGGGKTTYLRAIGCNLVLMMAGCPIMARSGVGYPFSSVQTHYPSDERFSGMGRLDDEQRRVDGMLSKYDSDGFCLFNETFSGANHEKGFALAMELAERMHKDGRFGLFVTHFHQVIGKPFPVLSVGTAEYEPSENENCSAEVNHSRTYRVSYSGALAYSYAEDILRKYGMDRRSLMKRSESGGERL